MDFKIDDVSFTVLYPYIEEHPKIGVYDIENSASEVVNYGRYHDIYHFILFISSNDELETLRSLIRRETVSLTWDGETFMAIPIGYRNRVIRDNNDKVFIVELAFRRKPQIILSEP